MWVASPQPQPKPHSLLHGLAYPLLAYGAFLNLNGLHNWGEPERAPHRRVERSQSIYVYIMYYIWYVRHPRAAIYNVQQLAIYSGGRMKKLLRSPVPRA